MDEAVEKQEGGTQPESETEREPTKYLDDTKNALQLILGQVEKEIEDKERKAAAGLPDQEEYLKIAEQIREVRNAQRHYMHSPRRTRRTSEGTGTKIIRDGYKPNTRHNKPSFGCTRNNQKRHKSREGARNWKTLLHFF